MSGVLGTSGGGAAGVTSVTAGNGITVTGTTTPTIAASLAAGTGVSIAGTTTLTVSATGVNSVSAGTGISVSGTTALTVSATGVNSIVAGTAISVSGTTTMTVTNTGVTALAGTGISVSAATGSVTVTPTYAAPTALTIGGTVVTGAAASVANSGHVHAMPGSAVAGASAVGDTAATGSATTVALSDHKHSREAFGTPGAVTGGATAASGSATTIARSDHIHSTASMAVLLGTTTLGSAAASYTFSSIRAGFSALELIWAVQSEKATEAVDAMNIRINGNTGSVYNSSFGNQTSAFIGYANTRTANFYNAPSPGRLIFTDVSTTTRKMSGFSFYGYNDSTTAYGSGTWMARPVYEGTGSVLSSLTIFMTYANMSAGCSFWLYGIP